MEKLQSIVPYDSCPVTLVAAEGVDNVVAHAVGLHASGSGRKVAVGEGVTGGSWPIVSRSARRPQTRSPAATGRTLRKLSHARSLSALEGNGSRRAHALFIYAHRIHRRPSKIAEESVKLVAAALSTNAEPSTPLTNPNQSLPQHKPSPELAH